ncbi:MAG: hypothetical protein AMJ78_04250 [Omnitrophica WOR_2 bacterium SM23_29]|nr:MAG: hypothetical protein AMJ78_04250 [Omnitrophica WOR_2 bacterium SM23_29]
MQGTKIDIFCTNLPYSENGPDQSGDIPEEVNPSRQGRGRESIKMNPVIINTGVNRLIYLFFRAILSVKAKMKVRVPM